MGRELLDAYKGACSAGEAFSVKTLHTESANTVLGFTTAPVPCKGTEGLRDALARSAEEVGNAVDANFNMPRRIKFSFVKSQHFVKPSKPDEALFDFLGFSSLMK